MTLRQACVESTKGTSAVCSSLLTNRNIYIYIRSLRAYHPGLPTYALVRFDVDDCLSVVPVKRIVDPAPQLLKKGVQAIVKWTSGKRFTATILAVGKQFMDCYL